MKRKDVFVSTIKGFIAGIAALVPGMNLGSMLASISSYDNFVTGIANPNKKKNKALYYIAIPSIIGIILGLIAGPHLIDFFWKKYQFQTIILFVGLLLGGIHINIKKHNIKVNKKNVVIPIILLIISIILIVLFREKYINFKNNEISIMYLALITGLSIFIPGISVLSSHIEDKFIPLQIVIKNLNNIHNIILLILFVIITILVIYILSKTIYTLLKTHKNSTYIVICTLLFINIIIMVLQIKQINFSFVTIFTSILLFLWGYLFALKVERE